MVSIAVAHLVCWRHTEENVEARQAPESFRDVQFFPSHALDYCLELVAQAEHFDILHVAEDVRCEIYTTLYGFQPLSLSRSNKGCSLERGGRGHYDCQYFTRVFGQITRAVLTESEDNWRNAHCSQLPLEKPHSNAELDNAGPDFRDEHVPSPADALYISSDQGHDGRIARGRGSDGSGGELFVDEADEASTNHGHEAKGELLVKSSDNLSTQLELFA